MTRLNWDGFRDLPGSAQDNFEHLCRSAMRANYGRYGQFKALAQQPGVEFHLKLDQDCTLGAAGRWYGWQCRWYGLDSGTPLGTRRRRKIREALETTAKHLPDLTDWILWTRHPLTASDQKWFYGLTTDMTLNLLTATDLEPLLVGDAELLRACYFSDLILTKEWLEQNHDRSVATVERRLGPVHQPVQPERQLRRMLGESTSWSELAEIAEDIEEGVTATKAASDPARRDPATKQAAEESVDGIVERALALRDQITTLHVAVIDGDLTAVQTEIAVDTMHGRADRMSLRRLRSLRDRATLAATNLVADAADGRDAIRRLAAQTSAQLVAVTADAGIGKTQLAAQLTAKTKDRPAGILLHGRDLPMTGTLDDLARTVTASGQPVPSFEALLAAVDSAGQRYKRRLPIVIDGLNEAPDPRRFSTQLAAAASQLPAWPQVLLVVTVRGDFYDQAVPDTIDGHLEIDDFGEDLVAAVKRYFRYYKIDPGEAELPWELLRHPLLLRLTCEVANPDRATTVGVEKLPASLTALFDAYINAVVGRISELSPPQHPFHGLDVRKAIDRVGQLLWNDRSRSIDQETLRQALGDEQRPWTQSLVFALEQDGILLAQPSHDGGQRRMAVVWDQLAGHIIASSLLTRRSPAELAAWLNELSQLLLLGDQPGRHTLADDITTALAGLLPRRHHTQLWTLVAEPFKIKALRDAANIEAAHLDSSTVEALAARARELTGVNDLLPRLRVTRQSPQHPLNSLFLDRLLRPLTVADRDLWWTEWLRANERRILQDLAWLTRKWCRGTLRSSSDVLRARWVAWTLASPVKRLRDQATLALYWFGRGDPASLFNLTVDSLTINDLYVPDRLLAVAYGIAMAHQIPDEGFDSALRDYLTGLHAALVGTNTAPATAPTRHALIRYYAVSTFELAARFYPATVPDGVTIPPPPAVGPVPEPIPKTDERRKQLRGTVQMDFGNYTMGRLFDDRRNYDMEHTGLLEGHAHLYGVIWELGWRSDSFDQIDRQIGSSRSFSDRSRRTERYGKKYGWIGFHTFAGMLDDRGHARSDSPAELDIDPSFPERGEPALIHPPMWARPTPKPPLRWLRHGIVRVADTLLFPAELHKHAGPWICVAGHLNQQHVATGRSVFGYLTAVLVNATDTDDLVASLWSTTDPYSVFGFPSEYYLFGAEFGWHRRFAVPVDVPTVAELYQHTVAAGSRDITVEVLAHEYAWESFHSELNQAAPALATSRLLTERFDLRTIPQTFSQTSTDGALAALSLGAPEGFEGELLYLRGDLLRQYAGTRHVVIFSWGERRLQHTWPDDPSPAHLKVLREGAQIWRDVRVIDLG